MTERLIESCRPQVLSECILSHVVNEDGDVVGNGLLSFEQQPYSCCKMFRGPMGTGKTTAALCLMQSVAGDGYPGFLYVNGQELKADELSRLWAWLTYLTTPLQLPILRRAVFENSGKLSMSFQILSFVSLQILDDNCFLHVWPST